MISRLVISYLVALFLATGVGLALSFSDLMPGFDHEYRTAAGLNFVLLVLSVFFCSSSLCDCERSLRLMLWFVTFEFLAPVFTIWVYLLETHGNQSFVFYYAVCYLVVPLTFFCGVTGLSLGHFVFE
jgi:hypothetical protein